MAKMNSKFKYMYDAAESVSLLDYGSIRTASFNGQTLVLDTLDGYWNDGELADQTLAIVINVESVALSSAHDTAERATITLNNVKTTATSETGTLTLTSVANRPTSETATLTLNGVANRPTSETATLTLAAVVTGNALTIADGTHTKTFTADTDFTVGADDTATATSLAAAINTAHTGGTLDATATAAGAVVTVKVLHGTGAAFSAVAATITASAFTGTDLVGDKFTITDGTHAALTFTAGGNLTVGGNDTATATNLAAAINAAHTAATLDATATAAGAVVTVKVLHPTGAAFSAVSPSFTAGAFSGTDLVGDKITIADGTHAATTFTAGGNLTVGVNDTATATNLAAAINAAHTAGTLDASATAAGTVVTVKVLHPTGAAFSAASASIVASAFGATDFVGDKITITDGAKTATFTAGTTFAVGGNDGATATNLTAAINAAHTAGTLDATATVVGAVVSVTALHPTGAGFSNASASFTTTAFAPAGEVGDDETYAFSVVAGPVDFATSAVVGIVSVVSQPGQYVVLLDMDTVKKSKPNAQAIRIEGLIAGTSPSITAYSWIAGILK